MTSAFTFTSDFHQEFEAETARLWRRRLVVYLAITLGLFILGLLGYAWSAGERYFAQLGEGGAQADTVGLGRFWAALALVNADTVVCILCMVHIVRAKPKPATLQRLGYGFFMYRGVTQVIASTLQGMLWFPGGIAFNHIFASALLPWTPWQSVRSLLPVLLVNAAATAVFAQGSPAWRISLVAMSPLIGLPGVAICWLRHSRRTERFKMRFLQTRYGQIRRDLVDARRIHESLFPRPVLTGSIRFDYRYEPMLQIGGDYLYARFAPAVGDEPPAFNLLLIDVTGHGIAAALTVNRLFGEVERLYAEDPHATPGDVLRALNRYVHLTLATHSVFVTALCLKVDEARGQLEFASGGHPPAFLRAVDGTIDRLESTAYLLGACADADFDPAPERRPFGPGDAVIAYTDGAIEARNEAGKALGVVGVERVIAGGKPAGGAGAGAWAHTILGVVEGHRAGPPDDDTIVVQVLRAITARDEPSRPQAAGVEPVAVG